MAKHPKVQKKAQDELDSLVGPGQLPTFEDKPKLVYIEAILRETMRWLRMVPLGKHHITSLDNLANQGRHCIVRIAARDDGRRHLQRVCHSGGDHCRRQHISYVERSRGLREPIRVHPGATHQGWENRQRRP